MQTIFNWLENKNVQLSKLLETFICLPICEHPQDHNRLGWKPYKNSLIISHHHLYSVITCIYLFVAFPNAFFLILFLLLKYPTSSSSLSCAFFLISLINTVMLIMFAIDFVCIFNHPTSIQVRESAIQTYIKILFSL